MSNKPLDAGPELDAAVARALGWDFTITVHGEVMLASEAVPDGHGELFQPSTNANTALEIIKACIPLHTDRNCRLTIGWAASKETWDDVENFAEGVSFQVTVCRAAIEKLKKPSP